MTEIIFNDEVLNKNYYFYPQRDAVAEIDNNLVDIGRSNGQQLLYSRIKSRIISVQYHVYENSLRNVEQYLSEKLVTNDTAKLLFSDRPNEFWYAMLNSAPTIVKDGIGISGVIEFVVPDGVSHALTTTTVTPDANNQLLVNNTGTATAYPVITATMKSDNGLVAFANDSGGVLQFGDPEEVDTVTKQKSDKVIDYGMRAGQTGFTQNVGPGTYTTYVGNKLPNKMQGSVTFDGEAAYPHYTSDSGVYWHGPTLHGAIPANSNGDNTGAFIWKNRFNFNTDVASLGHLEFTLTSGDKPVLMYTMRDSVGNASQVASQFWGAGLDESVDMNPKLFGNGFYEITISRDKNGGMFTLSKVKALSGDTVVAGSTYKYPFNDSVFQTMPIDGMTVWFQKFSNKKAVNMDWTDSKFTWVNVPYIEDVPNRFDTGDVVTVDVAQRKVYVNDVLDNTLQTVGNKWESFALQPGQTVIQPVASSWATMYDCKLTYREAWL